MKHEKHISITLCDVSNDLRWLALPGRKIVSVQRILVRGGIAFDRWESRCFCDVCAVHHI